MAPLTHTSFDRTRQPHAELAAALYTRLREDSPAVIATTAAGLVVGALHPLTTPTCWGALVDAYALATTRPSGGATTSTGRDAAPHQVGALPAVVGFLSYEAGRWTQPVTTLASTEPEGWLGSCVGGWLLPPSGPPVQFGLALKVGRALQQRLALGAGPLDGVALSPPTGGPPRWTSGTHYEQGVATVLDHIRAGDCYQVNLARGVTVDHPGDPVHAWLRLVRANPARQAMLLDTGNCTMLSNSPELLLATSGRALMSVPIKGTRPADCPPRELLNNQKERAELTMIVDLVRADLANVARLGSVRAGRRRVGRVGHLWHAMQRVYAELGDDRTPVDALAALFPAGSVTGAPRIRATGIIADLERTPRGAYCGAMGWFGPDGSASWNVAIRTLTFHGPSRDRTSYDAATTHFGSGIVWGSDPVREREETEWKARSLLAAVCA
ncbi:MAG: anthranilate synthase component I family protein [Myxococcales bacterium]|nr:anthranilate synthase component I family protein [Myxococcales bacterium]